MKRAIAIGVAIALTLLFNCARDVQAFSLGKEGATFGKMGRVVMKKGSGAAPVVGCSSTGIFNLNNTCNNIYLLTGSL